MTRPEKRSLRRAAFTEAAGMLGAIAGAGAKKVVGAVAKASARTVAKTASNIGNKVKNSADSVVKTLTFRRKSDS